MRNNETGEYELVVGNRQLLSGFFIVVLLCAVAFAMGYVVGENTHTTKPIEAASRGSVVPRTEASPEKDSAPPPTAPSPEPASAAPAAAPPPQTAAKETGEQLPRPTTQPAREVSSPEPPKRAAAPPEPAPRSAPPAAEPAEGDAGRYWQVLATKNHDSAETLVQTLKEKGFPATLSPAGDNLTRVLVGPYKDTPAMGRAKTELEAAGFSHMVRR